MSAGPAAAAPNAPTLVPAVMGANAFNEIPKATPHALAAFLATLPAVEG